MMTNRIATWDIFHAITHELDAAIDQINYITYSMTRYTMLDKKTSNLYAR